MATSVYFNGKLRTLPGAYSTITSGDSTASRSLDYGTVLIIDTGVYGAGFGGGAGVMVKERKVLTRFTSLTI